MQKTKYCDMYGCEELTAAQYRWLANECGITNPPKTDVHHFMCVEKNAEGEARTRTVHEWCEMLEDYIEALHVYGTLGIDDVVTLEKFVEGFENYERWCEE